MTFVTFHWDYRLDFTRQLEGKTGPKRQSQMIKWYVLQSKLNKEEFVLQQLNLRKITAYLPYIQAHPVNPRSRKIKPYFPGYLFININLDAVGLSSLQWIPGTIGLVSFGGEVASVSDDFLQPIRDHLAQFNSAGVRPQRKLVSGERVIIQSGAFAGYEAIFDSYLPGHERVRVLLQLLQDRQVKLDLSGVPLEQASTYQSS
jgi:transcriptional antiterminator RfaH